MKTNKRNFIVEYKSGRRTSKASVSSIWGDTDLKAVAKAVATDTDIFAAKSDTLALPPGPRRPMAVTRIVSAITPTLRAVVDVDAPHPSEPTLPALPEIDPSPVIDANVSAITTPAKWKRTGRINTPTEELHQSHCFAEYDIIAADDLVEEKQWNDDEDDLTLLEAENKRLKSLWRGRLEAENTQLRIMLGRVTR